MRETTQIPGQGALFGDSVPTDREAQAAHLEDQARLDEQITAISAAGDFRNKPDYDPNNYTMGSYQDVIGHANAEAAQIGPEPKCPEWAEPSHELVVGSYIPGFGPVTYSNLDSARKFASTKYDRYVRDHNRWEQLFRPEVHEHRLQQVRAARGANTSPADHLAEPNGAQANTRQDPRFAELKTQIGPSPDSDIVVSPFTEEERQAAAQKLRARGGLARPVNPDEPPPSEEDGWQIVEEDWPTPADPNRQIRVGTDRFIEPKPPQHDSKGSFDEFRQQLGDPPADVLAQPEPDAEPPEAPMNVRFSRWKARQDIKAAQAKAQKPPNESR